MLLEVLPFTTGHKGAKGDLKKGMEGYSARIYGRNTRGRGDDQPLVGLFFDIMKKGGLARTRFAGEKDMTVGGTNEFFGKLKLEVGDVHLNLPV